MLMSPGTLIGYPSGNKFSAYGTPGFSLTAPDDFEWVSDVDDNTPLTRATFTDLREDDVGRLQVSTDVGFTSPTEYTNTADLTEVGALVLEFTTGALADGQYWMRVRHEPGPLQPPGAAASDWSNVETKTIATAVAPVNTVAPVISGNQQVGQTLTTTDGTWTGTATINYTYQWQRDGVNIASATANTHVLVELDAGAAITCDVTGTNGAGNSTGTSNSLTIDVYVVYLSQILDGTNATTYSGGVWDTVSLGTAAANRKIVIAFAGRSTTVTPNLSSASVGAAGGSEVTAHEETNVAGLHIWEFANTADASANISATYAAEIIRCGARLYAVYGAGAGTPHSNYSASATSIANADVVVPANGCAISLGYCIGVGAEGLMAWTNSTADGTETNIEGAVGTIDSAKKITSGTVTITVNGWTATLCAIATVAYGPS